MKLTKSEGGRGQRVPTRVLDAVFARLDAQLRVEVRQTNCGLSVVSLRYAKPRRMQLVGWFNSGLAGNPRTTRDPRQTQIGTRLGYVGQIVSAPWVGMGVTAHRLLLPDAWHGMTTIAPTLYLIEPPYAPVRDLTVRRITYGSRHVLIERWRGLLYGCPPTVSCPAPNFDPRSFARYTAVLRVDHQTGLPLSLTTVAQRRGSARGRFVWGRVVPVTQAVIHYRGDFTVQFVKE